MKVALSSPAEVRLVTLRWIRVGVYRDDVNYAFEFGHFSENNPYSTKDCLKHAWEAESKAGKRNL